MVHYRDYFSWKRPGSSSEWGSAIGEMRWLGLFFVGGGPGLEVGGRREEGRKEGGKEGRKREPINWHVFFTDILVAPLVVHSVDISIGIQTGFVFVSWEETVRTDGVGEALLNRYIEI